VYVCEWSNYSLISDIEWKYGTTLWRGWTSGLEILWYSLKWEWISTLSRVKMSSLWVWSGSFTLLHLESIYLCDILYYTQYIHRPIPVHHKSFIFNIIFCFSQTGEEDGHVKLATFSHGVTNQEGCSRVIANSMSALDIEDDHFQLPLVKKTNHEINICPNQIVHSVHIIHQCREGGCHLVLKNNTRRIERQQCDQISSVYKCNTNHNVFVLNLFNFSNRNLSFM
jgi:hypothetical protein